MAACSRGTDGDLLGGAWGAAKLSDSGYVELRAFGGDDNLWMTRVLVELGIPLPPYLLLTPFVVGHLRGKGRRGLPPRRGRGKARHQDGGTGFLRG